MSSNFDVSVAEYKNFLEKNGYSSNIVWITSRDVLIGNHPTLYVRLPVPVENEDYARQLFDFGISQQRGVLFETICENVETTFIHAWVPRDDSEAQQFLMPKDLKMSASVGLSRRAAQVVRSGLHWRFLRWRYRRLQKDRGDLFLE